jgi:hypothetical protein
MEKGERIRRIKQCMSENLNLQLILDEYSWSIINKIAQTTNIPVHYIFLTTLIALCHWTMGAYLKGAHGYNVPLILFGILCGGSGMYQMAKKALDLKIDVFFSF